MPVPEHILKGRGSGPSPKDVLPEEGRHVHAQQKGESDRSFISSCRSKGG